MTVHVSPASFVLDPVDYRTLAEAAAARADRAESELFNLRAALQGDDARQAIADGLRRLRGSSNSIKAGLEDSEDAAELLADLLSVVFNKPRHGHLHPPVDLGDQDMPCP